MTTNYPLCDHNSRPVPGFKISEEIADAISKSYRTLPIFEKGVHEVIYKKHYSLENNEFLKCRWTEYKRLIADRVKAPVNFLNIRDYHFYNCRNRLMPSESILNRESYRMRLKPGPGVDVRGQIPIPYELFMKRGTQKHKEKKARTVIAEKEEERNEEQKNEEPQQK